MLEAGIEKKESTVFKKNMKNIAKASLEGTILSFLSEPLEGMKGPQSNQRAKVGESITLNTIIPNHKKMIK